MIEVEMPNGEVVEFPASMSRAQISAAVRKVVQSDPQRFSGTSPEVAQALTEAASRDMDLRSLPSATTLPGVDLSGSAPVSRGEAVARSALQSATFAGGDEGAAAVSGVLNMMGGRNASVMDETAGERYRAGYNATLERERERLAEGRESFPGATLAAEVGGAVLAPLGGAGLVAKAPTVAGKAARSAAIGAGAGAAYGFGAGEGSGRALNAALGGTLGAAAGAAAPVVGNAAYKAFKRVFDRSYKRPTLSTLESAKRLAYKAVDDADETFSPQEVNGLIGRVKADFDAGDYVPEVDRQAFAALQSLEKQSGKTLRLGQLDSIRQKLWKRYSAAPNEVEILDAIRGIDDLIDSRAGTSELLSEARTANKRWSKAKLLETAFKNAERETAGSGSGGNIMNKYIQAVTKIVKSDKMSKFFEPEELALMEKFIRGGAGRDFGRLVGKLAPTGNGLMFTLHAFGAYASNWATIPIAIAGIGAKGLADLGVRRGANKIMDTVSGRATVPTPSLGGSALFGPGVLPVGERAQTALTEGATPSGQPLRLPQ